jgi:hypothetical protein
MIAAAENVLSGERTIFATRNIIIIVTIITLPYCFRREQERYNVLHKKRFVLIVPVLCLSLLLLYRNSAG